MTDDQLKLELAKLLPESIRITESVIKDFYFTNGRKIEEEGWLHVCWLVEQTLTDEEYHKFTNHLIQPAIDFEEAYNCLDNTAYRKTVVTASWQQRAEAILKVKGLR